MQSAELVLQVSLHHASHHLSPPNIFLSRLVVHRIPSGTKYSKQPSFNVDGGYKLPSACLLSPISSCDYNLLCRSSLRKYLGQAYDSLLSTPVYRVSFQVYSLISRYPAGSNFVVSDACLIGSCIYLILQKSSFHFKNRHGFPIYVCDRGPLPLISSSHMRVFSV